MQTFKGFEIGETDRGMIISLAGIREIHVFLQILLHTKFPRSMDYDSITLLSPFINQLIDACVERLDKDPNEIKRREQAARNAPPAVFKATDEFTLAVIKAVDIYIKETGTTTDRNELLRTAFKPQKVEGFH